MATSDKFLTVGCWNKGRCDLGNPTANEYGVSLVMERLREDISTNKAANTPYGEVTVLGDNYYPPKVENIEGYKVKSLVQDDLISGFTCLPEDIHIKILLGNHEIDTIDGYEGCPILELQRDTVTRLNQTRSHDEKMVLVDNVENPEIENPETKNNCLCIYLDTNIYSEDVIKKDKKKKRKKINPKKEKK